MSVVIDKIYAEKNKSIEYSDSNQINQKNMSNNKAGCFEENKLLKKELALVKQERDLLKKAAM